MSAPGLRFTTTSAAERGNGALALCSAPARLLWFELRLLMGENEDEPGFLLIDGKRPTPAQIATLTGTDPAHVKELLAELEGHKVFTRDKRGVVYCASLVKRAKLRENGRRGGNPNLLPSKGNSGMLNQPPNQGGNQKLNQASPEGSANPLPAKGTGRLVNQEPNQAPRSLIGESELENLPSDSESLPKVLSLRSAPRPTNRQGSAAPDKGKRGTRLPADFAPDIAWAVAHGLPEPVAVVQAEQFLDFWSAKAGQSGCKLDWQAAWRCWVRKALDDHKEREARATRSAALMAARCGTAAGPPKSFANSYYLDALTEPAPPPRAANGRAGP